MSINEKLRANCSQCMLSKLCLPAGIDASDLAQLNNFVKANIELAKNATLFRAGEALNDLYVVSSGALKSISRAVDGDESLVAFHLPGELLGLDALAGGVHHFDTQALCPTRVCKIPLARLDEASQAISGLQRQLLRLMGRCSHRETHHIQTLSRVQAMERVARFLLELAERYRFAGLSDEHIHLPMSRQDIAKFLGVALETVSRNFSRLQDEGVLAASGRQVHLLNMDGLRAAAGMLSTPVRQQVMAAG